MATQIPVPAPRAPACRGGVCYLSSALYHEVYKIDGAGTISLFAGSGVPGFAGDGGPATAARLHGPGSLAVDASGNVYIADTLNNRVRRVTPAGIISTYAGSGLPGTTADGRPAGSADITPLSLALDSGGNLYIAGDYRIRRLTPAGTPTTVAGTGTRGSSGDGGAATAALVDPHGLALDPAGNLYFAEPLRGRVRKINTAGVISTIAGRGGFTTQPAGDGGAAASAALAVPRSVAVDSSGNVYIGEAGLVRKVDTGGIITRVAPSLSLGPELEVSVDGAGQVYVADSGEKRVWKIDAGGAAQPFAGNATEELGADGAMATSARLVPQSVAVDPAGNLAIGGERLRVADVSGRITTAPGWAGLGPALLRSASLAFGPANELYFGYNSRAGDLIGLYRGDPGAAAVLVTSNYPAAVAADPAGVIYFADMLDQQLRLRRGTAVSLHGGGIQVEGVAADRSDNVYFTSGDRVEKLAGGVRSTVAGTGARGSSGDGGRAASATLAAPTGVAVDRSGNVYVADTGNNRIRRIDTAGNITPVAGNGVAGYSGDGGAATAASLRYPTSIAVDAAGNLYIADSENFRVRKVSFGAAGGPSLSSLSPAAARAGSPAFTLDVAGANFTGTSAVLWNGAARPTIFVNSSLLRAQISASDVARAGSVPVGVAGIAGTLSFSITSTLDPPTNPSPADGGVSGLTPVLSWTGSGTFEVYFGASSNPPLVATQTANTYSPGTLAAGTTYYWRVVARIGPESASSPVWRFAAGGSPSLSSGGGLRFVPIVPCRVADTRAGQGFSGVYGPPGMNAGSTRDIPIPAGRCGIPTTAAAFSLNVTAVPLEPLAYLTLWPAGQSRPLASTLNSFHGGVVANAAIVPAGTGGSVSLFATHRTDAILDINGYFTADAQAASYSFYTIDPCRLSDTRAGSGFSGPFGGPRPGAGAVRNYPLAGNCGLPAAAAYSLNVTAVPPAPLAFLTLWPAGQPRPLTSTLNAFDGAITANAAIVPAGAGASISVFGSDSTDTILDANGYFGTSGGANELRFFPLTPCRIGDTREAGNGAPIMAAGESRDFAVAGKCGVPATARAYSMNVTVVPPAPLAFLTLWPSGKPRPLVSTLNSFLGRIVANAALVPAGANGAVRAYVTEATHVIFDVNGYFQ